jgi:hypothetical protein
MQTKKLGIPKLSYEIDGETYFVRRPTLDESEHYSEEFEKLKDAPIKERIMSTYHFISKLGIPLEVLKRLSVEDVNEIMGDIAGKKN